MDYVASPPPPQGSSARQIKKLTDFAGSQLQDSDVEAEALARQLEVPPGVDAHEALLEAVTAELQQMYGNVNTLFIHADKQVPRRHLLPCPGLACFGHDWGAMTQVAEACSALPRDGACSRCSHTVPIHAAAA